MVYLKPSEIYYNQASISPHFGRSTVHRGVKIGKTLDELCNGTISVSDIPKISVTKKGNDSKWYTLDNRRLWIFRHLEGAGKCTVIPCEVVQYISCFYEHKVSSTNGGVSVTFFYGEDPGGEWHTRIIPANPEPEDTDSTTGLEELEALVKKLGLNR